MRAWSLLRVVQFSLFSWLMLAAAVPASAHLSAVPIVTVVISQSASAEVKQFLEDERKKLNLLADQTYTDNLAALAKEVQKLNAADTITKDRVDAVFAVVIKKIPAVRTRAIQAWTDLRDDFKTKFEGQTVGSLGIKAAVDQEKDAVDALVLAVMKRTMASGGISSGGFSGTSGVSGTNGGGAGGCCCMKYSCFKRKCREQSKCNCCP